MEKREILGWDLSTVLSPIITHHFIYTYSKSQGSREVGRARFFTLWQIISLVLLQLWSLTTNHSQNVSFFQNSENFAHIVLCLESLSCLSSFYIYSLQYVSYYQKTVLGGYMCSRHLSVKKILPLKPRQVLRSWYPVTRSSDAESLPPRFSHPPPHSALLWHDCHAPQLPAISSFLSHSSGTVHSLHWKTSEASIHVLSEILQT